VKIKAPELKKQILLSPSSELRAIDKFETVNETHAHTVSNNQDFIIPCD
jgi:hypothetical protein